MKKTFLSSLAVLCISISANAQVPVMGQINGPQVACSSQSYTYSTGASNNPTSWSWQVLPSTGVVISNPGNDTTTIAFPPSSTPYTVYAQATNGSGTSTPATITVTVYETPSVTFSGAQAFCQGSSTNLSASPTIITPGSPTIFYNWSPSTGLSSTTSGTVIANPPSTTNYTVLITMNSCTANAFVTVTVNPVPSVSLSASPASVCAGQPVVLSPSGTASTYSVSSTSYTVYPQFNTTYTATGTGSNGCKSTAVATVTAHALPNVSLLALPSSICTGGMAALLTGGNASSYTLSPPASNNTVSPTVNTSYVLSGSAANGCTNSAQVTITVNPVPAFSVSASQAVICAGDIATVTTSGNAVSYVFLPAIMNNTASPAAATVYTVTGASAAGCLSVKQLTIGVNPLPTITAVSTPTSICKGETATLTIGGTVSSYSVSNVNPPYHVSPTSPTTYSVSGSDINGCKNKTNVSVMVKQCLGIAEAENSATSVIAFPNPSDGTFSLLSPVDTKVQIIDGLGRTIRNLDINADVPVKVTGLRAGFYFVVSLGSITKVVVTGN
jgi:hypothetical protein